MKPIGSANRRRIPWRAIALAVLLVSIPAGAQQDAPEPAGGAAVNGLRFQAGQNVRVEAASADDVFAAGEFVDFAGVAASDAFAAGRIVRFLDATAEDLTAVGRRIVVRGTIADDLITASETLEVQAGAEIGNNAILFGRRIDLAGRIGGAVTAAARRIELAGEVGGDADFLAERVVLTPTARIGGDLRYPADAVLERAPEAVVAGEILTIERRETEARPPMRWLDSGWAWLAMAAALIVLGGGLVLLFPGIFGAAAATVGGRPGRSALIGLALLIGTPIVVALLVATVIGIPLGLILLGLYLIGLAAALVTIGLWLGRWLIGLLRRTAPPPTGGWHLAGIVIGIVVLALLGLIPFVGGLLVAIATIVGLGGLAAPAWRRLHTA